LRRRLLVIAAVVAALVAIAALASLGEPGRDGEERSAKPSRVDLERVRAVAERVERLRKLRFRRLPRVEVVSEAQARRYALAQLERTYPRPRLRADDEVLKLLGLLDADDDIQEIVGELFGQEVAGFYDPRAERLALLRGQSESEIGEFLLAHELTHALEDQHYRFAEGERTSLSDDRLIAETALHEGTATLVMADYAAKHLGLSGGRKRILEALRQLAAERGTRLPPYVEAALVFPYVQGSEFVSALTRNRGWSPANRALGLRPPVSSEQILHPGKYARGERPDAPRLALRRLLRPPWRRVAASSVGEFDTARILRVGVPGRVAGPAAAGWGGSRYELWRSRPFGSGCPAPCRRRDALVIAWRWDAPADAGDFEAAARRYLARGLSAREAGRAWRLRGGSAALARRGGLVVLSFAPAPGLARRLAAGGARGRR
jgi:hypothetical protein